MLRFAVALSVVNNVVAFVRVVGVAVKAGMHGILHHLKYELGKRWRTTRPTIFGEPTGLSNCRRVLGLPTLVPAFATASSRRSYRRYRQPQR